MGGVPGVGLPATRILLGFDPSGSNSGSAVAVAANLCAVAVGTETDGSILSPAANNLVVGMKPTRGLVAQDEIIPIAHSQDTAGPMARTVVDVAILLGILQSPFDDVAGRALPDDYRRFLRRGALEGARIGVDRADSLRPRMVEFTRSTRWSSGRWARWRHSGRRSSIPIRAIHSPTPSRRARC